MKRVLILFGLIVAAGIGGLLSYAAGHRDGRTSARKEIYLDMAWASLLSAQAPEATPQLREYAKAQFYYYSYFLSPNIYQNLGPVDVSIIRGLEPFIRHADSPNDYYKNIKTEPSRPANPTPPGTSAAEQPRVPGSGGG
jgi:hypothetical protein